ncbi:SNF2 family N-terminal domain-containing protein [Ochromonadaceae sp. CCMP2298]|nr:SNF2 family N-terminal domain-containing protein [Ochromonadaceae sp. CCMP2298]
MRVPGSSASSAGNPGNGGNENIFGSFGCPANAPSPSTRMPSKSVVKEFNSMPRVNKRRIVCSDDEDTPVRSPPAKKPTIPADSPEPWMESRTNLTGNQRDKNIQRAVQQRKKESIKKTPKRPSYDSEEDNILDEETPVTKRAALTKVLKGAHKSKLLNETLGGLDDLSSQRGQANTADRKARVEGRETGRGQVQGRYSTSMGSSGGASARKAPTGYAAIDAPSALDTVDLSGDSGEEEGGEKGEKREKGGEEEDSDKDSDDESEPGYVDNDELDRDEIQRQANKVLRQCETLSRNLRRSLLQWETGADDEECERLLKGGGRGTDCVDLTSIKSKGTDGDKNGDGNRDGDRDSAPQSAILSEADVTAVCPDLLIKGYQLVGVNWLKLLHQNDVNGVLADDMGLGKTIQTIAFLGWLASQPGRKRPHLIVVPASVLSNWQNELQRFCPTLDVITYHGSQAERSDMRYEIKGGKLKHDVMLSTYTIFERESNKPDRSFLCSQAFDYLVLDEAHCIKNASSSRFINLNFLKTRHRLLLSGTPVQNDISELLSMLSFLMPQVFSSSSRELLVEALTWSTQAVGNAPTPSKDQKDQKSTKKNVQNTAQQQGDLSLDQLRRMLAPFVLRRLKRDVLTQLTDKVTKVVKMPLTSFQRQTYDGILLGHADRKDKQKLKMQQDVKADKLLHGLKKAPTLSSSSSSAPSSSAPSSKPTLSSKPISSFFAPSSSSTSKAVIDLVNSPPAVTAAPAPAAAATSLLFSASLAPPATAAVVVAVAAATTSTAATAAAAEDDKREVHGSQQSVDTHTGSEGSGATTSGNTVATAATVVTAGPTTAVGITSDLSKTVDLTVGDLCVGVGDDVFDVGADGAGTNTVAGPGAGGVIDVDADLDVTVLKKMSNSEANSLFTALRKTANHPLLLRLRYKDTAMLEKIAMISYHGGHFGHQCDYQRVRDEIDLLSDFDIHQLCCEYSPLNDLQLPASVLYDSPKMDWLRNNLPLLIADNHRMLVFSQWTRLLDLLEVLMQDIGLKYLRLDGATPVRERQALIDTFNGSDIPVFLLSTKAGGLGINLTAADVVIMHDLDFNPENDKQAEDRCHRIGQTRTVTVYKLLTEGSVDEDIFDMGERKSKLSRAVLGDKDGKDGDGDEDGGNGNEGGFAIGNILQRALQKRLTALKGD